MRSKIIRASSTARVMTEMPRPVRTRSAAARAASVAPLTAMPTSACFRAGASFTPSPVMPTIWPRDCSSLTILNLCSGNTSAKPSASSIRSPSWRPPSSSKISEAETIFVPRWSLPAISRGDGGVVAGHHADVEAHRLALLYGLGGVVPWRIEQGQETQELPRAAVVLPSDPEGAVALAGQFLDLASI